MFGRLNRLLLATAVAGAVVTAVLVGPSAALACNGGTSAVNVYKECGVPTGDGGGTSPGAGHSSGTTGNSTESGSGSGSPSISGEATNALSHAGKDGKVLSNLVKSYGLRRQLQSNESGASTTPSAVGSAFDLGSGPTALLILLAGTAVLVLAGSGMRGWRNRHRA